MLFRSEVFSIQNTSEGRCKVEALSQGTGLVTLTIRTKEGKILKETVFVSVYENILECEGVVGENAGMYRGASDSSGVENNDWKGELPEGETVFLTAVCGDYFRFLRKEENVEPGEDLMGFVKMSDITVSLTSISVEEQMFLDMGEEETLEVETWPEFAPEPDLLFHSNNLAVVMVDSEGSIRTGKAGTAVVTVSTADGVHEVKCTVYVDVPSGTPWEDAAQNEEDVPGAEESGAKGNLKKKKNKFNFQANGYTDKSIKLTWDKQKKVKYYEIQRATKKKGIYKTIKKIKADKKKYLDKSVKFYKNYWYRLVVVKKNGKILKSNRVKARTKDSVVNLNLRVTEIHENRVALEWDRQKHAEKYIVRRRNIWSGEKVFKKIKVFEHGENSFVDQTADQGKKYEYVVEVKKSNKKVKRSDAVTVKTLFAYDNDTNIRLFRELYPFVCTDEGQNMNEYHVFQGNDTAAGYHPNGYYSPIKYSYDNGFLTIHLYCEFIQYISLKEGGYEKREESSVDNREIFNKYKQQFQEGIRERYQVIVAKAKKDAAESRPEFREMNFEIRFIFHEKGDGKETYHASQVFNEIMIGGECPNCTRPGDHWFHHHPGGTISKIYMPFENQLSDNENPGKRSMGDYSYIAAHEMGHMMGLKDAYLSENGEDRFTDNAETGVIESEEDGSYDNIMVERKEDKYLLPNDLQMMFKAYSDSKPKGKSWCGQQAYKTHDNGKILISDCILNRVDNYDDTRR